MPTAAAKAQAWNDAVVRDDVANETMRSIAYSFGQAGQDEVLRRTSRGTSRWPRPIWDERSVHQASTVLEAIFPRTIATQQTLDTVDAWLEGATVNPAARRYVVEGRSDLKRALDAQRRDAEG